MRSRGRAGLLALALVILLSGILIRSLALVSLVIPLVVFLLLGLFWKRDEMAVSAEWTTDEADIMEGEEKTVVLTLRNHMNRSASFFARLHFPNDAELKVGRSAFPVHIGPGGSSELKFVLRFPRRGRYELGDVKIEWFDHSSMTMIKRSVPARMSFRVMPYIFPLDEARFKPKRVRMPVGNLRSRQTGPGIEFHSLREYGPGDERRQINWKATARTEYLLVNQNQAERSGDVTIVLDVRAPSDGQPRDEETIDREVSAACSLAAHYLQGRDRVGMLVLGDFLDVVEPAYGRKQFHRLVDRLLEVRSGGWRTTAGLPLAMRRFFPSDTLVLVITPLDDSGMVRTLKEMERRGHDVAVLAIHPSQELKTGSFRERLKDIDRQDDVHELRSVCTVLDWDADMPLASSLTGGRMR
jgi:uncharacterized protein (DUF58 family)